MSATEILKHGRPEAFYDEFSRKGEGEKVTHYCPGCGHGVVHKLVAEATSDMGVNDRVIFCSPVGCSVFAYYYLDYGNIQCAHGQAPAVATGLRRTRDDAVVICYQGDGDLAGIGLGGIVHAANRGENITVLFVNNAIYGMTGGQTAPTTLVGQRTVTSPEGRSAEDEGHPIRMAEVIDALEAPVYVERVSLAGPSRVLKARRAIRKALQTQVDRKGFSFVEILSPCPVNWQMSPVESRRWMIEHMEPVFTVRRFRDRTDQAQPRPPRSNEPPTDQALLDLFSAERGGDWTVAPRQTPIEDQLVKIAGFGGQGVLSAGVLLANCVAAEGLNVTWLPSYGPEMRGGTANASVIASEGVIGAPVVDQPNVLIAMNGPSLDAFEPAMEPGGLAIVNGSLISREVERGDLRAIRVPATEMASRLGSTATASVIMLAVYAAATGVVRIETLEEVIPHSLTKKDLIEVNLNAVHAGVDFVGPS